ncbi:hypothetical protein HDU79_011062 [Rhizoclosmatium sp. JEL0117]|nr:hypothetical protein HDU79_011062 [Rhizoclosmatium sp. JEL0117]
MLITTNARVECICCPSGRQASVAAPFDGAVRAILIGLQKEFGSDLLGVLVTGSIITPHVHVNSDVDIFAIIAQEKRQRRLFQLPSTSFVPPVLPTSPSSPTATATTATTATPQAAQAQTQIKVQCEVFVNPASRMLEELNNREDPTVQAWRLGHVLYESNPLNLDAPASLHLNPTSFLRARAIETYKAGKPTCATWSQFKIDSKRYFLMDGLLDAWDAIEIGDAASGSIMLSVCLSNALDVLYESRGWWSVKPKKRLLDLKENAALLDLVADSTLVVVEGGDKRKDAKKALQLSRRIARDDLELVERYKSLKSLIDLVVEPLGGGLHEWVTDWEAIPTKE